MDDSTAIEAMFAHRVGDPREWYKRARALISAARASEERAAEQLDPFEAMEMHRVTSMLYGLALEGLFKALIVLQRHGDPTDSEWCPEARFPKELGTHDLLKLGGMVDAKLPAEFGWELTYFTDAVVWMGRYPCSKSGEEGSIFVDSRAFAKAEAIYKQYSRRFSLSG
ncbi:hypothetical protein H4F99_14350 [Lysobacter sp. SG-8]|uniref:HEPN domain-containing protein n=1 Tax=Marilutibacter penaei TaxID=2759900 RepID=A0A7W3YFM2_9GAMM|nr:hypothetical protein [Lysobacter penaei]MBB1089658.1 hypothetical protein [Lysobacter penaei]